MLWRKWPVLGACCCFAFLARVQNPLCIVPGRAVTSLALTMEPRWKTHSSGKFQYDARTAAEISAALRAAMATEDGEAVGSTMKGQCCLVTGAGTVPSENIGLEVACAMASLGADVLVTGRTLAGAKKTVATLNERRQAGSDCEQLGSFIPIECDLSCLQSVRECADRVRSLDRGVRVIVCCAAYAFGDYEVASSSGHEMHFATNHLGHFLLVNLLLDLLRRATPARVVMVSSDMHHAYCNTHRSFDFDDLHLHRVGYDPFVAYSQSKVANVLMARELHRRMQEEGSDVFSYSICPGLVRTGLLRHQQAMRERFSQSADIKTPGQGGATVFWCAAAPEVASRACSGRYWKDCQIKTEGLGHILSSDDDAQRLWELSEKIVGLS